MSSSRSARIVEQFASCPPPTIHMMSVNVFDPVHARSSHVTPYAEMFHLLTGRVEVVTRLGRLKGGPGDVMLIPSRVPHRDRHDIEHELAAFMIHFSWEREAAFFDIARPRAIERLGDGARAEVGAILERLRLDYYSPSGPGEGPSEIDRVVAQGRLLSALLVILRDVLTQGRRGGGKGTDGDSGARRRRRLAERAKAYLSENYHAPVSLDDIAEAVGVSSFYLSRVFSQECGLSLVSYLTSLRMEKARALLGGGDLSVSEVARRLGYQDSNYFSKVFKRRFGRSPRDYHAVAVESTRPTKSRKK